MYNAPTVEQLERSNPRLCEIVKYSGFERLINCGGIIFRLSPLQTKKGKTFSIEKTNIKPAR